MAELQDQNIVGAIIFFSYILWALLLTILICRDLLDIYSQGSRAGGKSRAGSNVQQDRRLRHKVFVYAALCALSFSSLSFHMLIFLIQSYQSWAVSERWRHATVQNIWRWSINSNLFQDFAEVLCDGPEHFWWTHLILLYTFGWNVYMCVEGT